MKHKSTARQTDSQQKEAETTAKILMAFGVAGRRLLLIAEPLNSHFSLGPRGLAVLGCVATGIAHPTALAEIFAVGRSLITADLKRLTAVGLLESTVDPADRRHSQLRLTELGAEVNRQGLAAFRSVVIRGLKKYTPAQRQLFARMLDDFSDTDFSFEFELTSFPR
jgi:DNA-binding MarR family transcriptional regulator